MKEEPKRVLTMTVMKFNYRSGQEMSNYELELNKRGSRVTVCVIAFMVRLTLHTACRGSY